MDVNLIQPIKICFRLIAIFQNQLKDSGLHGWTKRSLSHLERNSSKKLRSSLARLRSKFREKNSSWPTTLHLTLLHLFPIRRY